jgi:Phage integrase, N-terminal SAM-like domain
MAEAEVTEFLIYLARDKNVAASTQNQALSALLFLYKEVLKQEIGWLGRELSNTRFSAASLRQESNEVRHTMKDKESGNNIAIISNAPPKNEAKYQNANDNYYSDRVERLHDSNFSSVGARRHPAEQPWLIRVSAANGGKQTKSVRRNRADEIKLTGRRPEPRPSRRCVQAQTLSEHFS